jgi:hypothetical protein
MPSAGFETATSATKRPQTYVLDRAATGIGVLPTLIDYTQTLERYAGHPKRQPL